MLKRKQFGPKAFTLIELLLVISIIGLLAAIVFPVLASAKASAKSAVCLSNVRSIGLAIEMYRGDADGRFPWGVDGQSHDLPTDDETINSVIKGMPPIQDVLRPYVKSNDIWLCPMDRDGVGGRVFGSPLFKREGSSYWYQTSLPLSGAGDSLTGVDWIDASIQYASSQIIVLRDWSPFWHGDFSQQAYKYNALYADGHASHIGFDRETRGTSMSFR